MPDLPRRDEVVICTVKKLSPYSANVLLDEYNKEGILSITEASRRPVRNIREVVKEGQKYVMRVVKIDGTTIYLSLKRVSKYDSESKKREFKRSLKEKKLVQMLAQEKKIDYDAAFKESLKLKELFGDILKGFQASLTEQGHSQILKAGVSKEFLAVIKSVAEKQLSLKEMEISQKVEVRSLAPDGIEKIRDVLLEAKKRYGISVNYISSPFYRLSIKSKDPKMAEKKLKEAAEFITKSV